MRWALLTSLGLAACRHLPDAPATEQLPVSNLIVAFPRQEQGDLFFEVGVPAEVVRVASVKWVLRLSGRRFAEGLVMTPDVQQDAGGTRRVRVEAPLVYRHVSWRDGSTWLQLDLSGEVQPFGVAPRLGFQTRQEVLVSAAPVLDERVE